ncbi:XRE family transcriptional regulator [Pedobacter gandavensis]|uniref:XRE family transcriptional regulator n=1 Tax=Pedobacter gandavensis TaxID=2679963 RepID=A0ABR6EUC1_9SPHI|nr:XRE family transcriptional regulator [Pedobacter gandavensis]MBB2148792.1 XRE family transcriptional regulator [Pedobacter gandavensis]
MNTIKGLLKLGGLMSARDMMELDEAAKLHLKHSNISFKVISIGDNTITVKAEQGKHLSENYADVKRLNTRTQELFSKFLPEHKIIVQPVPFQNAVVDEVDPKWIEQKMFTTGTRLKDIQGDTGVDKTNLSAWVNGTRPMSQPVKAMFYYYFANKK